MLWGQILRHGLRCSLSTLEYLGLKVTYNPNSSFLLVQALGQGTLMRAQVLPPTLLSSLVRAFSQNAPQAFGE